MIVPPLDLKRQYQSLKDELDSAVLAVLAGGSYALGPEVEAFEREIADYLGVKHAVACASGSDALLLALMALDVGPGDEVITTPFTFFATASTVTRLGARPVFVDIRPDTFNIDPDLIEPAVTDRTRAIIPVHLFGQCARMDVINDIAARHALPVIEDACQSIGARQAGAPAGTLGAAAAFSFYPAKNLAAAGDAGLLTTSDDNLASRLRRLRLHGADQLYRHNEIGINSRMDALQGAILRVKLKALPRWTARRQEIAARYDSAFRDLPLTTPACDPDNQHVYYQYVLRVPDRDALARKLTDAGVAVRIYYPLPLHLQPCFGYLSYARGDFPHAEKAADEVLALPVFPEMTSGELDTVIRSVIDNL